MAVAVVELTPFCCCMPWGVRGSAFVHDGSDEIFHGAACCFCDRAIAAPANAKGKHVACIYCGLDRGFLPQIEIEPFPDPT